jgi:hypothetical protein
MFHFTDKFGSIKKDARLRILSEGPDWYCVSYRGGPLYVPYAHGYVVPGTWQ